MTKDWKNFSKVGNVPAYCTTPDRNVSYNGLITTDNLILKHYEMWKVDEAPRKKLVEQSKKFIEKKIIGREIDPYIGLGFSILSKDMLNVARWDDTYPIVLQNQVYTFDGKDIETARLEDIRKVGSFCIWELAIVESERHMWKKYLGSERRESDKEKYISSFCQGKLD